MSRDPRAFIVRGGLGALGAREHGAGTRAAYPTAKAKKGDDDPSLVEVPCPWLMIDIDNFPLRPSDDLADDPEVGDRARHQRIAAAGVPRHGSLVAAFILGRLQRRYAQSACVLLAV